MKAPALSKASRPVSILSGQTAAAPKWPNGNGVRLSRFDVSTVDQVMAEERAAAFAKRSIKTSAKLAGSENGGRA